MPVFITLFFPSFHTSVKKNQIRPEKKERNPTEKNNTFFVQKRRAKNTIFCLSDEEDKQPHVFWCKCQRHTAASAGVNGAALLCSRAQIINHENGHILVVPVLSLRALIKQFCGLESQIPLLQITINYAESAQRCWTQLYSAQPWLRGDSLF